MLAHPILSGHQCMLLRIVECMLENLELYILLCIIEPCHQIDQRVSEEENINFPKVPPSHICTTPVKCTPKENEEEFEGETSCVVLSDVSYILWYHFFMVLVK